MEKAFLNDKLVDIDKTGISVTDSGFLYGAGLFETMRGYNGVVFALDDHLDRLFSSCKALSINNTYDKKFITEAVYKVLEANKLSEARLRVTLTSGSMLKTDEQTKSTLLITATKLRPYPAEYYQKGVSVVLCPFKQNPDEPTCGHKTTSYFPRITALNLAHKNRAAEALWFTTDNRLAEGCISNVFLVRDSKLYTPPVQTPVLPGVTRKTVCQIASQNSIELVEKDLYIDDVLAANEIFLTNAIMQIMPINRIEKHAVGAGSVGAMTRKLTDYFNKFVKEQCRKSSAS